MTRPRRRSLLTLGLLLAACSGYQEFDSTAHLRAEYERRLGSETAASVAVPYALNDDIEALLEQRLSPAGSERRRVADIIDFVFEWLDLSYALVPTRSAVETFEVRQGNCLSFVNLFVGIARRQRLNPFYVEVEDLQRWRYRDGSVVSQGHIVAGIYLDGELSTFDFLPYRAKAYRNFDPIDDLTAAAHYYNNLGAEALMAGDLEGAGEMLSVAVRLAPDFAKATNNYGLYQLKVGNLEESVAVLSDGLERHPDDIAMLTNLAQAYQRLGESERALELLKGLDRARSSNPFFFIYRAEMALASGDATEALRYMRDALRRDTEIPEVHVGLVKVYLALGDVEKARHHVSRALLLDATHEEAREYAVMLAGEETDSSATQ